MLLVSANLPIGLLLATTASAPMDIESSGQNPSLFGLVIGTNISRDPGVKPLRYADDDAVQNAKLLSELGAQVVLLVQLDSESEALYTAMQTTRPTKTAVRQAFGRLNALITEAQSHGRKTALYLFYSGHGDVENNEGYVNLWDGRLWRRDLLELLQQSRADQNHVIVDACKSYFLLFARGAGGIRSPVFGSLLAEDPSVPENTGVFLSTSAAADSHEWEAFQGGIFSHEVRSALRGAADQDLDGSVTYEEAGAFVWTANQAVPNPRFRPKVYIRPPGGASSDNAVLVQLSDATGDRLRVGPGATSHLYVEDAQGLRLIDLRPEPTEEIVVLLPSRRPLFVRRAGTEQESELPKAHRIVLAELATRKATAARRGAEHVAFRKLFEHPFGSASILAYRNRPPETGISEQAPSDLGWLRKSLGIGAAVLAVTGGTMTVLGVMENRSAKPTTNGVKRQRINERIDHLNVAAVASYASAAAALASYLAWTFWPDKEIDIRVIPASGRQVQLTVEF